MLTKLKPWLFLIPLIIFTGACRQGTTSPPPRPDAANETRISGEAADAAEPWLATDQNGTIYLVYVEQVPNKKADVYFQKLDPALKPVDERVRVNTEAGTAKSWRGDPPTVTITGDGTVLVGWTSRVETETASGTNYMLSVSHDEGDSFDVPVKINDDERPASHGMHSLAAANDGTIIAAWLDERNVGKNAEPEQHGVKTQHQTDAAEPNSELFVATSDDGGRSFSPNRSIARDVCPCCKTSLLAAENGRVYVGWRQVLPGDFRHISVAVSDDRGKTFSTGSIVSDDRWRIAACPVSGPSISTSGNELDLVWYTSGEGREPGYYFASAANGDQNFGAPTLIAGEASGGSPVLLDNGTTRTVVLSAPDDRVQIFSTSAHDSVFKSQSMIEHASSPSAVLANGSVYLAFVRKENGKSSVWVMKR